VEVDCGEADVELGLLGHFILMPRGTKFPFKVRPRRLPVGPLEGEGEGEGAGGAGGGG
jgi:hypothetical protein